jgi:hypothetical protein
MTDTTVTPARTSLTLSQAATFLQAMAERDDDDAAPWPACLTCAAVPSGVGFPDGDGALLLDYPCGHRFAVAEAVQAAVFEGDGQGDPDRERMDP